MNNDHANVAFLPPTAAGKLPFRHHRVIEPANGPISVGVCKFCLETREFKNSIDTSELPLNLPGSKQRLFCQTSGPAP